MRTFLQALLAVAASSAAFYVSTGTHAVGIIAWIAPLPVLIFAFGSSGGRAFLVAFAASLLGSLNLVPYLSRVLPHAVIAELLTLGALLFAVAVSVARYAFARLPSSISVFAFPVCATSFEFLQSLVSPHGTAGSFAYSQMDYPPVFQVCSVTGIWGIVFLLTLFPSSLAVAFHSGRNRARAMLLLALPAALEALSLGYGWVRLAQGHAEATIRVGLAVTDSTVAAFNARSRDVAIPVLREYARRAGALAARGARIVLLPEKFVGVTDEYKPEAMKILGDAARQGRVTLVAGLNLVGGPAKRNVAVAFGPDGGMLMEYDKARMLPGAEDGYRAGNNPGFLRASETLVGVAICKDMDFPRWTREYARAHASLLLVPAWDFVQDAKLHSRMALARAVEGGFPMVRCAQQGLATVCDSRGRILAEAASYNAPEQLLIADVAPEAEATLYTQYGDWFGWTCVILLGVLLASSARAATFRSASLNERIAI